MKHNVGLACMLLGCNAHPIVSVEYEHGSEFSAVWCTPPRLKVDVLVVIDDSASMALEQATVVENLREFVELYESQSWQMDYRIAVTTTDVGTAGCDPTSADDGAFSAVSCRRRLHEFEAGASIEGPAASIVDVACREACSLDDLALLGSRPWIERIGGVSNVPEGIDPAEAFACIGSQGVGGCAFESPLEAMVLALARAQDPRDPAYGFMRPDASLFVLFITDEDDCSFRSEHFDVLSPDGLRALWSDREADAPTSAVCTNAGVRCDSEAESLRCRSAHVAPDGSDATEDAAVLHPLSRYSGLLASIADQKRRVRAESGVFVSVVGGAPLVSAQPFDVDYARSDDLVHASAFGLAPGCSSPIGEAQPPVRLRELTQEFYDQFQLDPFASICNTTFIEALACIPQYYDPPSGCLEECVGDDDVSTQVELTDCAVVEELRDGTSRGLPRCIERDDGGFEIPSDEPRGCAIVHTGSELLCAGANAQVEVLWRLLPDASCVHTVCRSSLLPSIDCPGLGEPGW